MSQQEHQEDDFSLKKLFVPLTTLKAIHIIVIVGFIVFGNMLFNGFVWDDKAFIINNPDIHKLDILHSFGKNWFNNLGQYRPIPSLYFDFLYQLFNNASFFYHFLQITIHIINTVLLFILFKHFFNRQLSLFLSILFLVHPVQVESVSYIASSGNPLFFLFGIIALLISLGDRITFKNLGVIFGFLILSALTKETGFLFLVLVILFRILSKKGHLATFFTVSVLTILFYFTLRLGVAGVYFSTGSFVPIARLTFEQRLINIPAVIFYYLKTFFFPVSLAVEQQWTISTVTFANFYLPLMLELSLLLLLCTIGAYLYKISKDNGRTFLFFFTWFLLGLFFHSQLLPLDMIVADRWFYFSMVGLLGTLASLLKLFKQTTHRFQFALYLVLIIIIALFSIRTIVRNANWSDEISLYTHDIKLSDNFQIENDLGAAYADQGNYKEALMHAKKSVDMYAFDTNLFNTGAGYEITGNVIEAEHYYVKALKSNILVQEKRNANIYLRLAHLYILNNKFESARNVLKKGLMDYPSTGGLWSLMAISQYGLHNQEEALAAAEKAKMFSSDEQGGYVDSQIFNKQPIEIKLK